MVGAVGAVGAVCGCLLLAGCATTITGTAVRASDCCGATVIEPAGAPYCYVLPAGFRDDSGGMSAGFATGRLLYPSAVAAGSRDGIVVAVLPLPAGTNTLSPDALVQRITQLLDQGRAAGIVMTGTPTLTTVDGDRAVEAHVRESAVHATAVNYFVLAGDLGVEIACQSAVRPDLVDRGCRSVLDSIRIDGASA